MPRHHDSGRIDLSEVFRRVQREMVAQLSVGQLFEHASSHGAATERHWLELFERYLPQRYRAAPAFVIDSAGRRSRQIDLAIFDNLSSPRLFPHASGAHIPAESVYAVFEIKPTFSKQWLRDAGEKAASVRSLRGASPKLLSGLLATSSVWNTKTFAANLTRALSVLPHAHRIDIGCSLQQGSFECRRKIRISTPEESLIFFIVRLLDRLAKNGPAKPTNLLTYLPSFK
jgi:hypothetical protein